ncbi:hypothetical protein EDB86DRAFT_2833487 [Lactarius hatsudake]|nr:hypothetical protein EDB86DRAFT_2833487 [Lactarius hatsudake]
MKCVSRVCRLLCTALSPLLGTTIFVLFPNIAWRCTEELREARSGFGCVHHGIQLNRLSVSTCDPGAPCASVSLSLSSHSTGINPQFTGGTCADVGASALNELFPQLPVHLLRPEALHIVPLVQHYNLFRSSFHPSHYRVCAQETSLASFPLLEAFASPRFLTFEANGASFYAPGDETLAKEH